MYAVVEQGRVLTGILRALSVWNVAKRVSELYVSGLKGHIRMAYLAIFH